MNIGQGQRRRDSSHQRPATGSGAKTPELVLFVVNDRHAHLFGEQRNIYEIINASLGIERIADISPAGPPFFERPRRSRFEVLDGHLQRLENHLRRREYTAAMPRISAPTLDQHRTETTERLLDSFGELVMQRGYSDVSLADVAGAAGLARTALYTYFPDREALLFAWTDREVQRTMQVLEEDIEKAESYSEKLRVFIRHQLSQFSARHLPPGREVIQFLRPDTYKRFMDHIEPLENMLSNIVKEGAKAREFADLPTDSTVSMIMACIGAERGPLSTGDHKVDEAEQRVSEFILRAIEVKAPRGKRNKKAR